MYLVKSNHDLDLGKQECNDTGDSPPSDVIYDGETAIADQGESKRPNHPILSTK